MLSDNEYNVALHILKKALEDDGETSEPHLMSIHQSEGNAETGELVTTKLVCFAVGSYTYFVNLYNTGGEVYRYVADRSWNVFPPKVEEPEVEEPSEIPLEFPEGEKNEEV